jgi:hypothetical protein
MNGIAFLAYCEFVQKSQLFRALSVLLTGAERAAAVRQDRQSRRLPITVTTDFF